MPQVVWLCSCLESNGWREQFMKAYHSVSSYETLMISDTGVSVSKMLWWFARPWTLYWELPPARVASRYVSEKSDGSNVLAFGPQTRLLYMSNFTQMSRDVYRNISVSKKSCWEASFQFSHMGGHHHRDSPFVNIEPGTMQKDGVKPWDV